MKSIFFILLVYGCIGIFQFTYAMEDGHKDGDINNYSSALDVPMYKEGEIQQYSADRDSEAVKELAWNNLEALTSVNLFKGATKEEKKQRAFQSQVLKLLDNEVWHPYIKVYLLEGKPKGYIAYCGGDYFRWFNYLTSTQPKKRATILQLAVAEDCRKKGIGGSLVTNVIDELKDKDFDTVSVHVIAIDPMDTTVNFYTKRTFKVTVRPMMTRGSYAACPTFTLKKQIKPTTVQQFKQKCITVLKSALK